MEENKYITKQILKPTNPFHRCGGYHGTSKENHYWKLDPIETAFGNYLYAIELLVGSDLKKDNISFVEEIKLQSKIDSIVEMLDSLAMTYIDLEEKTVKFDSKNYKNSPKLCEIVPLMPYVVQYVAAKNGYCFVEANVLTKSDPYAEYGFEMPIKRSKKITDKDMIKSVCEIIDEPADKYLKNNHRQLLKI